jgi:glycosyltransferase involved in cell wall biosynthesis
MTRTVSVVMAAWNAEPYVEAAVQSVLGQSYPILELIVVNDGSTDGTLARLKAIEANDRRLRVLTQPNQGFPSARNAALREARGEWIAVADADDVQLPDRIATQMSALARNPEVTVCGAGIEKWDGGDQAGITLTMVPGNAGIRALLPFESPLFDPTSIYRASLVGEGSLAYDPSFRMAADYDFWSRLAARARFMNIPDIVTRYRRHPQQVTETAHKSGLSLKERGRVWTKVLRESLSIDASAEDLIHHESVSAWPAEVPGNRLPAIAKWILRLKEANRVHGRLDGPSWILGLSHRWFWVHRHSVPFMRSRVGRYFSSSLAWNSCVPIRSKVALVAKALRLK